MDKGIRFSCAESILSLSPGKKVNEPTLTDDEIEDGLVLNWMKIDHAYELVMRSRPKEMRPLSHISVANRFLSCLKIVKIRIVSPEIMSTLD